MRRANQAVAVDAPVAPQFHFVRYWLIANAQRRSPEENVVSTTN
jgi:hypothetical protein